jgi:rhodanese-related sulfurtransferase
MGVMSWLLGAGCEDLTAEQVKQMKQNKEKFVLVDVRTPQEHASRKIDGSKLIPLQELGNRFNEIPKDADVVLFCQNGIRSIMACRMLKKLGYSKVRNMSGGISRW